MHILRQRQVTERVGYSPMHIWRLEKAGAFPRRIKLGPNSVGWLAEEIDAWIEAKVAARDAVKGHQPAARPSEPFSEV